MHVQCTYNLFSREMAVHTSKYGLYVRAYTVCTYGHIQAYTVCTYGMHKRCVYTSIYGVYIRAYMVCTYGMHIQCVYTVLANPT